MSPKVSVVVAAYNVEHYIERCLKSLLAQTLSDIEIIIVNDGSIDNTRLVIEEFLKDKRITVIDQENAGLSAARNSGINKASSEYISFLDGDDYVKENMYELLYNDVKEKHSDLVICGFTKKWENDGSEKDEKFNKRFLLKDVQETFLSKHDEPFVVAWNKLFKLSLIKDNDLYFENKAFFEDVGFMAKVLSYTSNISIVEECLIYYMQRNGSITSSYNPIISKSYKKTLESVKKIYEKHNINKLKDFEMRLNIYLLNYELRFMGNSKYLNRNYYKIKNNLPLKHKLAVILIKLGIYKQINNKLKGNHK